MHFYNNSTSLIWIQRVGPRRTTNGPLKTSQSSLQWEIKKLDQKADQKCKKKTSMTNCVKSFWLSNAPTRIAADMIKTLKIQLQMSEYPRSEKILNNFEKWEQRPDFSRWSSSKFFIGSPLLTILLMLVYNNWENKILLNTYWKSQLCVIIQTHNFPEPQLEYKQDQMLQRNQKQLWIA